MVTPAQEDSKPKQYMEQWILQLLQQRGKMTTKEIKKCAETVGLSCPDEPVRFLNKLRVKGVLKGQVSIEHKGWLWWV